MLDANQPMFIVWGAEQTLLYNDRYVEILQGHHPHALGRPFLEVWSEIADDLRPLVAEVPIRRDGGGVDGFFCPCNETTEQVMTARIVQDSENRNRQIFDSVIDYAVIATDLEGRVTSWNEGAHRVLGWTEQEMLGERLDCFFTPETARRTGRKRRCAKRWRPGAATTSAGICARTDRVSGRAAR